MVVGLDTPPSSVGDPLPPIPKSVLTPDRQIVNTSGPVWVVQQRKDGGTVWNLRPFDVAQSLPIHDRARDQFALFVSQQLQYRKGDTVKNLCQGAKRFFTWWSKRQGTDGPLFSWDLVTEVDWRAFLDHGLATPGRGNDFSRLRQFFQWGAFVLEFPEFDRRLALTLKTIRAPGNRKGDAVRNWDPVKGPLDDDEVHLIVSALHDQVGTRQQRALVHLFLELGVRPLVCCLVRKKHLGRFTVSHDGSQEEPSEKGFYHLQVPKLKGREAEITAWKIRPISEALGNLLWDRVSKKGDDAPLFPESVNGLSPFKFSEQPLSAWARTADLISPRTGKRLVLNPRRFRYTLPTRMAFAGASREQIAEILDHADLQNVEVYIEAAARGLEEIDEALENSDFDPFMRRFEGKVVRREDPTPFPNTEKQTIPGSIPQIPTAPFPLGAIGWCGRDARKDGLCSLAPPLSCYLCDKFAAFDVAPHAEIADAIESTMLYAYNTGAETLVPQQIRKTLQAIRQLQAQIAASGAGE